MATHISYGEYNQAGALLEECLSRSEEAFGKNDSGIQTKLLYDVQGKYDKADPLYLDSLSRKEATLAKSHPESIEVRKDLAHTIRRTGLSVEELEYMSW